MLLRYLADSNRRTGFCRPLPSHSATSPISYVRPLIAVLQIRFPGVTMENGTPGRTRTCNLRIRSALLYPVELRAQDVKNGREYTSRIQIRSMSESLIP